MRVETRRRNIRVSTRRGWIMIGIGEHWKIDFALNRKSESNQVHANSIIVFPPSVTATLNLAAFFNLQVYRIEMPRTCSL